jgi:uncharacterized membrane protein (UPF0127 family)
MDSEQLRKKLHPEEEQNKTFKVKFHKYSLAIQIVVVIVILVALFSACSLLQAPKKIEGTPQACFKHDVCIDLILVTTPEELETGLSNYTALPPNTGMLFVFSKAEAQRMWMKGMKFKIDMFWISDKGRIVHIEKSAVPCTPEMSSCEIFEPNTAAKYVLETEAGFAIESNLFDNDKVEFVNIPKHLR